MRLLFLFVHFSLRKVFRKTNMGKRERERDLQTGQERGGPVRVPSGHPMLPWAPFVELLGRDDVLQKVRETVKKELSETRTVRSAWHVTYAAGRAGSGKTELGKQLPRILASDETLDSTGLFSNSAYLLIDCNGGGDGYETQDDDLDMACRLGWRLLAAVCRGALGFQGVQDLRAFIRARGSEAVARRLERKSLHYVAKLVRETLNGGPAEALKYAMSAKAVLRALAIDLRQDPTSNERVAIFIHVDEHQMMWGLGLKRGASEEDKCNAHKAFLYDLCTLRGNGGKTWCRNQNMFMFPIFTGTASAVLAPLFAATRFSKLHLRLAPFTAREARQLFLASLTAHESWLKANTSGGVPMDFVLSELGRVPRLLIEASTNSDVQEIFSNKCEPGLVHAAFNAVRTSNSPGLTEQLTRLIVAGVEVNMNTIVDGRTIAQHEYDGLIIRHYRPGGPLEDDIFAIRVPATEYRTSVSQHLRQTALAAFAMLDYSCPGWNEGDEQYTAWSELFEKMMMERFQNMVRVHREILGRTEPMAIEDLYPDCGVWTNPDVMEAVRLPRSVEKQPRVSLCSQDSGRNCLVYNRDQWQQALGKLPDGSCHTRLLAQDHPAFDVMHLHREGNVVFCFLEQLKNRDSPTNPILPPRSKASRANIQRDLASIRTVMEKFQPVMVHMTKEANAKGLELQFIPVYCDRRIPSDDAAGFWAEYWRSKKGLAIAATVAGSQRAMAGLFPCLEHRFVLLEEQSTNKGPAA
jgi:hypothetical protein